MADSDIQLTVSLSTKDVKAKTDELRESIQRAFNRADAGKLNKEMQDLVTRMDTLSNTAQNIIRQMEEMENTHVDSPEYANLNEQLTLMSKKYEELARIKSQATGADAIDMAPVNAQMNEVGETISNILTEMQKLQQSGKDTVTAMEADPSTYEALKQALGEVNNEMAITVAQSEGMGNALQRTAEKFGSALGEAGEKLSAWKGEGSTIGKVGEKFSAVGAKIVELVPHLGKIGDVCAKAGSALATVGRLGLTALKGLGKASMTAFSAIAKGASSAFASMKKIATTVSHTLVGAFNKVKSVISKAFNFKGVTGGLGKLLKNVALLAIGVRGITAAFNKLKSFVKEGMSNLTAFDSESNQTTEAMNELNNSLSFLKNAWASAFAPILNAVLPVLNALIDKFAQVGNAIARVTGMLTGQAQVINAVKGDTDDYKKSMDGAGGSAKKLSDRLASFDDLNVLGKDDDSGGGGGGGASDMASEMFEYVSAFGELGDMIKKAMRDFNFKEVGEYVGEQLTNALYSIPWGKIQETARNLAKGFATFLSGVFGDKAIWESMGHTLSEAVNTISIFVDELFRWSDADFGGGLASMVNQFFMDTDWGLIESNFGLFALRLKQNLISFLQTINWDEIQGALGGVASAIGKAIGSLVNDPTLMSELGIMAGELLNTFGEIISGIFSGGGGGGLLTFFTNAVSTINWSELATAFAENINNFFSSIDPNEFSAGVSAFFESITSALVTFITTVDWTQVIETFLMGIDGMFAGIQTALASSDNPLVQAFGSIVGGVQEIFESLVPAIAQVINALIPVIEQLAPIISDALAELPQIINDILPVIQQLLSLFVSLLPTISSIISAITPLIEAILPVIESLLPPIVDILIQVIDMILPVIISLIQELSPIFEQIITAILPVIMTLLEGLQPVFDTLITAILPVIVHLLDTLMPIIQIILDCVCELLEPIMAILPPILELIGAILPPLIDFLGPIVKLIAMVIDLVVAILSPILELIAPLIELITSCLSPVFELLGFIGDIIEAIIIPIFGALSGVIQGVVVPILKFLVTMISTVIEFFSRLNDTFKVVVDFFREGAKEMGDCFKGLVNKLLGFAEGFINFFINGLNNFIDTINTLRIDVPDWVPAIGGQEWGFNLSHLNTVSLPRLAEGAVIPPNREFMAVLGDQTSGTNIEAPLDTIKQAVAEELSAQIDVLNEGFSSVVRAINDKNLNIGDKEIAKANARYTNKQKIIRGTSF